MIVYGWLIFALWFIFYAYWAVMALGAKKSLRPRGWWLKQLAWRGALAVLLVLVILALRAPALRPELGPALRFARAHAVNASAGLGLAGVVLCVLGFGLTVWARVHLGRNWGVPMSRKAEPELVTSGPYAWVRHPIYSGMLLAVLGTVIGASPLWIVPLGAFVAFLAVSARREERAMLEQFPEQYAAYRQHTKMLVPFLL